MHCLASTNVCSSSKAYLMIWQKTNSLLGHESFGQRLHWGHLAGQSEEICGGGVESLKLAVEVATGVKYWQLHFLSLGIWRLVASHLPRHLIFTLTGNGQCTHFSWVSYEHRWGRNLEHCGDLNLSSLVDSPAHNHCTIERCAGELLYW